MDSVDGGVVFGGEGFLELGDVGGIDGLQFGYGKFFSCWFHDFLLWFLEHFPKFDGSGVRSDKFKVLTLILKPLDGDDFFFDFHGSERIELSTVWLEFWEVVVGGRAFFGLFALEDDDSTGFISNCEIVAGVVEGDGVDDVFFKNFLVGAFVAEELGEFVVGGFGGDIFLHLFWFLLWELYYYWNILRFDTLLTWGGKFLVKEWRYISMCVELKTKLWFILWEKWWM